MKQITKRRVVFLIWASCAVTCSLLWLVYPRLGASSFAIPSDTLWPILGATIASLFFLIRAEAPGSLGNLPRQIRLLLVAPSVTGLWISTASRLTPLNRNHLVAIAAVGAAVILSAILVFGILIRNALTREFDRLDRKATTDSNNSGWRAIAGVLSVRAAVIGTVVAPALVALVFLVVHLDTQLRDRSHARLQQHVNNVAISLGAQLQRMDSSKYPEYVSGLPPHAGEIAVTDTQHRLQFPHRTLGKKNDVITVSQSADGTRYCVLGTRRFVCAERVIGRAKKLFYLHPPSYSKNHSLLFFTLGLGLLGIAAFAGWAVATDVSADFGQITNELTRIAQSKHPSLERQLTVTTIDEVGDLIEQLGRLRHAFAHELRNHEQALEKTKSGERRKNKFLTTINRELSRPLDALSTQATDLLDDATNGLTDNQTADIRMVYRSSRFLHQLVHDVLDISLMQSGRLKLAKEWIDLTELIAETRHQQLAALKRQDPSKLEHVKIETNLEAPLPNLFADPRRIRQIVNNLISNAAKFTQSGRILIGVSLEPSGRWFVMTVDDTGIGINPSELPHIFDAYKQVGERHTQRHGTGLGLAIVKRLVVLHDGQVHAESKPGQGSRFVVKLPRVLPSQVPDSNATIAGKTTGPTTWQP